MGGEVGRITQAHELTGDILIRDDTDTRKSGVRGRERSTAARVAIVGMLR